jgi:hypothetical protein
MERMRSGFAMPGETITLRFAIWDDGDGRWDSTVLVDHFTWQAPGGNAPFTPPVTKREIR